MRWCLGRPRRQSDERSEEEPRRQAECDTRAGEQGPRQHASRLALRGRRRAARRAEEHEADDLDEAEDGERRGGGERRQRGGAGDATAHAAVRRNMEQRLQGELFGGEAVQRRQPGDRHRADEERGAGPGHLPQKAAEAVELERADSLLERTRPEEEEGLEDRVVEGVQ